MVSSLLIFCHVYFFSLVLHAISNSSPLATAPIASSFLHCLSLCNKICIIFTDPWIEKSLSKRSSTFWETTSVTFPKFSCSHRLQWHTESCLQQLSVILFFLCYSEVLLAASTNGWWQPLSKMGICISSGELCVQAVLRICHLSIKKPHCFATETSGPRDLEDFQSVFP